MPIPTRRIRRPFHSKALETCQSNEVSGNALPRPLEPSRNSNAKPWSKDEIADLNIHLNEPSSVFSVPLRSSTPVLPQFTRKGSRSDQQSATSTLPPSSPFSLSSNRQDFGDIPPVLRGNQEPAPTPDVNDPFGFLAAEKKLKAQRTVGDRPRLQGEVKRNGESSRRRNLAAEQDISDSDEGVVEDSREAFATPPVRPRRYRVSPSPKSDNISPMMNFRPHQATPRRTRKRKPLASPSSGGCNSPGPSSAPSTPSPRKHGRGHAVVPEKQPANETAGKPSKAKEIVKRRGKKSKARPREAEESKEEDVMAVTKELEALLPRRPVRRLADAPMKAKAKGRAKRGNRGRTGQDTINPGGATRTKKLDAATSKPKQKKSTCKREDGEGESYVLDDEEREKFTAARQARLEYYKKLDSYEIEKENVYVV